jgi:signal recognition particle subunit SRP54
MASRILGMGDVLTLIEKAEQQFDMEKAQELAEKLKKNRFTLQDYYDQMVQLKGMGDLEDMIRMMPGVNAKALEGVTIDDKIMAHTEAIILSMTPQERENPAILNSSRKKRIAAGCGLQVVDVNRLLKEYGLMQQMTKQVSKMTGKGKKRRFGKFPGMGGGMPGLPF